MKFNDKTLFAMVGTTNGIETAVSYEEQTLTGAQKAQARDNIGAAKGEDGSVQLVFDNASGHSASESQIYISAEAPIVDADGEPSIGRVSFFEDSHDGRCQLIHIADGSEEDHAATVGQVVRKVPTATFKVGDNILTDNIVTLGAGWSGSLAAGFTHAAGNAEPLTFAINSADGDKYIISFDFGSPKEAGINFAIGNSYQTDPYGAEPMAWGVQSVDGGSLTITPVDSSWAGTIGNLKCQKITADGANEVTVTIDSLAQDKMTKHIAGFWDVQLGSNALKDSINTTRCIAIGHESLGSLKTGGRNISVGTYSAPYMEYGQNNIFVGADSAFRVQKADGCIGIGKAVMQYGKDLKDNIAIGYAALYGYTNQNETVSYNNIAIGGSAGYKNCSYDNIFIGQRAGYHNNNYGNVLIGQNAGGDSNYKTDGNRIVAIGSQAGVAANRTSATVIGYGAKTEYSETVAIGANANAATAGSIAIGHNVATTKSNQVVIGKDSTAETLLKGNLVVRGTDGVKRQIVFNTDGTCSWTTV